MTLDSDEEIPAGWIKTTVGEIFEIIGGGTPPTNRRDLWGGNIPWVTSADIDENHNIIPRARINELAIQESATNLVPAGSVIVVTRVGLGKVGIAQEPLCFSQDSQALLFNSKYLDPKFVVFQMSRSVAAFKHIGRGTTISGVTKQQLRDVVFFVIPFEEQRRLTREIEKQFARLDDAVAALNRVAEDLKLYRASLLKAACEGRLVPTEYELTDIESRNFEPATDLAQRILKERSIKREVNQGTNITVKGTTQKNATQNTRYDELQLPSDGSLPEIPPGWCWISAGSLIASIRSGSSAVPHNSRTDYPILRSSSVRSMRIDFDDVRYLFEEDSKGEINYLSEQDVLFTRLSGTLDFVGNCAVVRNLNGRRIQYPDRLFCAKLVDPSISSYLEIFFASPFARNSIAAVAKSTAGHQRISMGAITEQPVALPPLAEQHRIVAEVRRRLQVVDELTEFVAVNLERAEELRRSILKRAFAGGLVPQDPHDEPASILLERIAADRNRRAEEAMSRKKQGKTSRRGSGGNIQSKDATLFGKESQPSFQDVADLIHRRPLSYMHMTDERSTVEDLFRRSHHDFASAEDIDRFFVDLTKELVNRTIVLIREDDEVFLERGHA